MPNFDIKPENSLAVVQALMNRHPQARVLDLAELIASVKDDKKRFLLTGPSGIGKSYIASQLSNISPVVGLDKYGERIGDRWIVEVSDAPKARFYEGQGDNVLEWARHEGLILLIPVPSLDLFRRIQAAKAKEYEKKKVHNEQWLQGWQRKSKFDRREYLKWFSGKLDSIAKYSGNKPFFLIVNEDNGRPVTKGWF